MLVFNKYNLALAVLMAPVDGDAAAAAGAGAPAVKTTKAPSKDDLMAMISEQVGKAVVDAIKANEAEATEGPASRAFELRATDRARAGLKADGEKGLLVGGVLGWMMRANGNTDMAYRIAKRAGADARIVRALGESTMAGGGAFVPQEVANDYIELLYAHAPFLAAGPRRVPVAHGSLSIPKVTGGATATWSGESVNAGVSEQTFGQRRLDLKKLSVVTPISNELLRDSSPALNAIVRDDLAMNAGVVIDAAMLRSTGAGGSPRGVKSQVASGNTFAANATANIANVTNDLIKAMRVIENAKVRLVNPAWFISPTVKYGLMAARDGNGNLVWAPEMATGKLYGIPFHVTTNIPSDLGGSSDESEVYLVEMSQVMVGDDPMGLQISLADGVAYHDGSAVQSAFSKDESVARLIQRIDMILRQDGNEAAVITAVDWDVITAS